MTANKYKRGAFVKCPNGEFGRVVKAYKAIARRGGVPWVDVRITQQSGNQQTTMYRESDIDYVPGPEGRIQ